MFKGLKDKRIGKLINKLGNTAGALAFAISSSNLRKPSSKFELYDAYSELFQSIYISFRNVKQFYVHESITSKSFYNKTLKSAISQLASSLLMIDDSILCNIDKIIKKFEYPGFRSDLREVKDVILKIKEVIDTPRKCEDSQSEALDFSKLPDSSLEH